VNRPTKILVFAAHPDDETLGCGGLITKCCQEAGEVHIVVMTGGSNLFKVCLGIHKDPTPAQISAMRKAETVAACDILGVPAGNILFLDYEDGHLGEFHDKVTALCVERIEALQPDAMYVTSSQDAHSDHRSAYAIAHAAREESGTRAPLYQYSIHLRNEQTMDDLPGDRTDLDITPWMVQKRQAVECFACHLKIKSPHQDKPLWASAEEFLRETEVFVLAPNDA